MKETVSIRRRKSRWLLVPCQCPGMKSDTEAASDVVGVRQARKRDRRMTDGERFGQAACVGVYVFDGSFARERITGSCHGHEKMNNERNKKAGIGSYSPSFPQPVLVRRKSGQKGSHYESVVGKSLETHTHTDRHAAQEGENDVRRCVSVEER